VTLIDQQPSRAIPLDPAKLRRRFDQLEGQRTEMQRRREKRLIQQAALREYLELAPKVDAALDKLSEELFGKLAALLEEQLTLALQEVLAQPIRLKVTRDFKRGASTMKFHIENNGQPEDIMKGQGGSVANILSVGLRLFALAQLDGKKHRRFLVLDEQDCWLAPELVPRLIKIVRQAGHALKFQVIVISHHDVSVFEKWADKVIRLVPTNDGVKVEELTSSTS
jgi:DNA repair exonuclease SbcCD ATPase subunit